MADEIVIEGAEIDGFMHFLKACKSMSAGKKTDMTIGPEGIGVMCGESGWGFAGNLSKERTLEFNVSKYSEYKGLDFDDIVKLKTKDLDRLVLNPDGCLTVRFLNENHNDIFTAELCV